MTMKEKKKKLLFKPQLGVHEVPDYYTAHDLEWMADMPLYDINGYGKKQDWFMRTNMEGTLLHHKCNKTYTHSFFFYFQQVFPIKHLPLIVALTNKKLQEDSGQDTGNIDTNKLLKFFGIVLLIPRMGDMPRRNMWRTTPNSKYGPTANLGLTGMSRHQFEAILRNITFLHQQDAHPSSMSNKAYHWLLVDDFIKAINAHWRNNFTPAKCLCVDKSII